MTEYELIEWGHDFDGYIYAYVNSQAHSSELIGPYDSYEELIKDIGLENK